MKEVKVSIITPTFNSGRTIARTIESVLKQGYRPLQYIIVDNLSSDDTLSIIESFRSHFIGQNELVVISEEDYGIYDAMNKGIAIANGDLVGIINSDDWYEEGAIDTAVDVYGESPESIVYGMLRLYKEGRLFQVRQNSHEFLNEVMCQHPTWFVPKAIYDRYGVFDDKYKIGGDYELANRYWIKGVDFVRIEKVMANFSLGGASSKSGVGGKEWLEIQQKYGHIPKVEDGTLINDGKESPSVLFHFKAILKGLTKYLG